MSQEKPLHPFPLTVGDHLTELLDPNGFTIIDINTIPILQGYNEKLGPGHWALLPGSNYEMTAEHVAATTMHTFVSYNCHQMLVDALRKACGVLSGTTLSKSSLVDACTAAKEALEAVENQTAIAKAALYEPSGEVAQ